MSNYKKILSFLSVCMTFLLVFTQDQNVKDLENKQQNINKESSKLKENLKLAEKRKKEIEKKRKNTKAEVGILEYEIRTRNKLINSYEKQISQLNKDIDRKAKIKLALENDLEQIKAEYTDLVIDAYRHQNDHNQLLFIFQSKTFNDLINRLRYIEKYTEYRKQQADLIIETRSHIQQKLLQLNQAREKKIRTLDATGDEKKKLSKNKDDKKALHKKLTKDKQKVKAEIDKIKKKDKALQEQMAAIMEEITILKTMAQKTDFNKFKGKLVWPVPKHKSLVIKKYGNQKHPLYDLYIDNPGIDISTDEGEEVKSVFKGEVVQVMNNPIFHKVVFVSHGDYFTIYSNLDKVYVAKGDKLKVGDKIGKVFTDNEGVSSLHFEVWQGKEHVNPLLWLSK